MNLILERSWTLNGRLKSEVQMEWEQIEEAISIYMPNQEQESPDYVLKIQEVTPLINEVQFNLEGLQLLIQNFSNYQHENTYLFTILSIKDWIKNRADQIDENLQHLIQNILFTESIAKIDVLPSRFSTFLASTQVAFMTLVYPEHWPDFWFSFLNQSCSVVYHFLEAFLAFQKENQEDVFQRITLSMMTDNSEQYLVEYLFRHFNEDIEMSLMILNNLITWINPIPIIENEECISVIMQGLQDPKRIEPTFGIIIGILQSDISPETKEMFVNHYQMIQYIDPIIQASDDLTLLCAVGSFINEIGVLLLYQQSVVEYFDIALRFFSHQNESVSFSVFNFVNQYTGLYHDSIYQLNEIVLNRLSVYFQEEREDIDDYGAGLIKILNQSTQSDKAAMTSLIENVITTSEITSLISIFHVLLSLHHDYTQLEIDYESVFLKFVNLIESPPILDYISYLAMTSYLSLFIKKCETITNAELCQECFNSVFPHLIAQYEEHQHQKFVEIIAFLLKSNKYMKNISVPIENIILLVESQDTNNIEIAAKMINVLPPQTQPQVLEQCLSTLEQILQQSQEPKIILEIIIKFIGLQRFKQQRSDIQYLVTYMTGLLELSSQDDALFSIYMISIEKSFSSECFPIFCQCIDLVKGMESTAEICKLASIITNNVPNHNWIQQFVSTITPIVTTHISGVYNWHERAEDARIGESILENYFQFALNSIKYLNSELVNEIIILSLQIVQLLMNVPQVLSKIFKFLSALPEQYAPDLCQFVVLSMAILDVESFDPYIPLWRTPCRMIALFHQSLFNNANELFCQAITACFNDIPNGCSLLNNYYQLLQTDIDIGMTSLIEMFKTMLDLKYSS